MPLLKHRSPKYSKHRATGQAVVTINGHDIYLGPHGTRASRIEYDRVIREWEANGRRDPTEDVGVVIKELLAAFWIHAQVHYHKRHATSRTSELGNYRDALRPLKRLYAETPVADFGPLALKAVRQEMIDSDWCLNTINRQIGRIKHVFRWGLANDLVPADVYHAIAAVAGLQEGRTRVRESEPIKPVRDEDVDAVLPFVSRQVGAMIELQRITGARPTEICLMTTGAIDRTDKVWTYSPAQHKTSHRGLTRTIHLGERCQEIITPFLKLDPSAYIFSPAEAEAERLAKRHDQRKTPMHQGNAPGSNRKRQDRTRRSKGDHYTDDSYRRAIARACADAFPPPEHLRPREWMEGMTRRRESLATFKARLTKTEREELSAWRRDHLWNPYQLRHTAATEWRKKYGAEATLVLLGDTSTRMIDVYAEKNLGVAKRIMAEVG
jgi:site-specific recombinase XerD